MLAASLYVGRTTSTRTPAAYWGRVVAGSPQFGYLTDTERLPGAPELYLRHRTFTDRSACVSSKERSPLLHSGLADDGVSRSGPPSSQPQEDNRHHVETFEAPSGRAAAGGAIAGALLASLGLIGPAGATTQPAANSTIVGSGSATTYYLMQSLDSLFNDSQGCQIFDPTRADQTLNFACE